MKHRQLSYEEVIEFNRSRTNSTEIILFLDGLRTPENVAGIFRLAACYAIQKIIIHGSSELLFSKAFRSVARIHENHFDIVQIDDNQVIDTLDNLKNSHSLVALEYTSDSVAIHQFKLVNPIVLILGNERHGIQAPILERCDASIHIPMYGPITSLNVQQACAIALYQVQTKR